MKTKKDIFNQIAHSMISAMPEQVTFKHAVLEIKRLVGNVGYTGFYITEKDEKKWLDIFNFKLDESYIENLYQITQNQPPVHVNWNRAKYFLYLP